MSFRSHHVWRGVFDKFFPEAGVQERMKEHGKDPLWNIKYEQHFMY